MNPDGFRKVFTGGFGDPLNHYAHSGAWFQDRLLIGTSRANLQFLQLGALNVHIHHWPVNDLGQNYSPDFEKNIAAAEIWSLSRDTQHSYRSRRVYQSPYHPNSTPERPLRSEISYRSMCVFKDRGRDQSLFIATTSRSEGDGPDLLFTQDGINFQRLPKPHVQVSSSEHCNQPRFSSIRSIVQFDDLLVTCVTGGAKGNINHSLNSCIYASPSPTGGVWSSINGDGFGAYPDCFCVFSLCVHRNRLYASTAGINGFSLFRGMRTGDLSFSWEVVVDRGAGRGSLNQGIASMCSFGDALYLGTGIQNGGYDRIHKVGPAAFELLRLTDTDQIECLVGSERDGVPSRSAYGPGFNNPFNAYLWTMAVHQGRLYLGTLDTRVFALFTSPDQLAVYGADQLSRSDLVEWLLATGGADMWSTDDGEFWEPVTTNGFNNFYNYGIRSLISANEYLFAGTANPFGPKVWNSSSHQYEYNHMCGTEIIMID